MYVYRWPPLAVVGHSWGLIAPVSRSQELFQGAVIETAAERRRRVATLVVEGAHGDGGGLMRVFERLLDGGLHTVRLWSPPANHLEEVGVEVSLGGRELAWRRTAAGPPLAWRRTEAGNPLRWFRGAFVTAGAPQLELHEDRFGMGRGTATGLPPSQLLARVGQFITVYNAGGTTSETQMLVRQLRSNADGVADVWTVKPFSAGGPLQVRTRETGIFKPDGDLPTWSRGLDESFRVTWSFREFFADETAEQLVEVDPWEPAPWA